MQAQELDFDDPAAQEAFHYGLVFTKIGPDGSVSHIPLNQIYLDVPLVEEPADASG